MSETVTINGREFPVVGEGRATRPLQGLPHPSPVKAGKGRRAIAKPLDGAPVASGTLMLSSHPPSVNALFFNKTKGRGKTLVYRNWLKEAGVELSRQSRWHVAGKVVVRIWVGTRRGDIDNRIKATLDLLVAHGRIEDDANVVKASAESAHYVRGTMIHIEAAP